MIDFKQVGFSIWKVHLVAFQCLLFLIIHFLKLILLYFVIVNPSSFFFVRESF